MKAFLLDIDGTTLLGADPLPGAQAFVTWLRAEGIPHLWMTNNTSRSRSAWLARLEAAGLEPRPEELYTSGDATIEYLGAHHPEARIYLVGPQELRGDFEAAGLNVVEAEADTVVLAYDVELTYAKIRTAALLLQEGAAFFATHPDVTCPTPEGPIPDVGSFLAMFELACGRTPVVIGKPEATMAAGALARLGVEAHEAVMVGDRLATDLAMARRAGLMGCLVLSGVTAQDELFGATAQPDHVFADLAAVHDWARTAVV
ncbi:MAG: HAD-IIA family hydrolase [Planctomycetota bacterium]|nr:HAD-IIA family hydrolase [Planctomycetota bacterium]